MGKSGQLNQRGVLMGKYKPKHILVGLVTVVFTIVIGREAGHQYFVPEAPIPESTASLDLSMQGEKLDLGHFANASGNMVELADKQGKVLLVNLWASYCQPCKIEMSELSALQELLGGEDLEVVSISVDKGGIDQAASVLTEWNASNLAVYADTSREIIKSHASDGIPITYIVDRHGAIKATYIGALNWSAPEIVDYIRNIIYDE